jgi:hypothetical protein
MPPRSPPHGFRSVLRWQLDDVSMLLGSDTVIFREDTASLDTWGGDGGGGAGGEPRRA